MSEEHRGAIVAGLAIGIIAMASATAYWFVVAAPGNTLSCSVGSSSGCTTTNASVGTVNLSITDPPLYPSNVTSIKVTVSEIDIHLVNSTGGKWVKVLGSSLLASTTVDLIQVINKTQSLGKADLPPGNYTELRLIVSSASATVAGSNVNLAVPSGLQTGINVPLESAVKVLAGSSFEALIRMQADWPSMHNGILQPVIHVNVAQLSGGAVTLVSAPTISASTTFSSTTVNGTVTVTVTTSASLSAKSCPWYWPWC